MSDTLAQNEHRKTLYHCPVERRRWKMTIFLKITATTNRIATVEIAFMRWAPGQENPDTRKSAAREAFISRT
jgi:hypothetical protein